jgi:hypothetical protein
MLAIAAVAIALASCTEPTRVLLPDIPMPPGVTARAVPSPGDWTSLTAEQALAIARAGGGPKVGANPVVRFLWLESGERLKIFEDGPSWIIVWEGERAQDPVAPDQDPRRTLTWTVVSVGGERRGSTMDSASETLPPN